MRVLVTGSNGYIGTVLTPMLVDAGHDVVGMDTNLFERSVFLGEVPSIRSIDMDVRDFEIKDAEGFDAILHLAGLSNDPLGDYRPELTDSINFRASVRVAEAAKAAGVMRFIFASSCSNYGAAGDNFLDESSKFRPVTPYGKSKVNVELEVSKLADDSFSPVFLRASTAYGLSPRIRFDLVINNLTAWAYTTKKVYLKSDGTPWRPVVHIEDISRAYIAALEAPREIVHNRAFNVGATTENYQISELAEIVKDIVPGCTIEFAPDAGPDKRCYRVNCERIATELPNFKPQWTARRGVEQLYEAYCQANIKLDEFEGPQYKRIAHVKQLVDDGLLDADLRWTAKQRARSVG